MEPHPNARISQWAPSRQYRHFRPIPRDTSQQQMYAISTRTTSPVKAFKRGHETFTQPDYVESVLVQLCRAKNWSAVIQRCNTHPEEAIPQKVPEEHRFNKLSVHSPRSVNQNISFAGDKVSLYHHTALGIACVSKDIDSDEVEAVVDALLQICPEQVSSSQVVNGHTPLRDAIKNAHCTPRILNTLLKADIKAQSCSSSHSSRTAGMYQRDRDGLYPIDHLIIGVQLGSPKQSMDLLKEFVKASTRMDLSQVYKDYDVSPLIRLLTLGTAYGSENSIDSSPWTDESASFSRLSRILDCAKHLLSENPTLLYKCSRATGCSPLHIALRNYGNFPLLTEDFISRDIGDTNIRVRNHYRDLPLHVACSAGVPIDVLRLVLERTISASSSSSWLTAKRGSPHPLIWSVNHSGYTPIDLEWVRHIESGKSLYSARAFFPLEVTGIRKHCDRQNEYYRDLLDEAVLQVLQSPRCSSCLESSEEGRIFCREQEAKDTFGILVDRLGLLILAASSYSNVTPTNSSKFLLHAASSLSFPHGPCLPLPVFELFLWLYPDQTMEVDNSGRLPIHCALDCRKTLSPVKQTTRTWKDWKICVTKLLQAAPQSSEVEDTNGRLPLHIALDNKRHSRIDSLCISEEETQPELGEVVKKLVERFPSSVDSRDPISKLYPFMLAATSSIVPLDTVFFLLRRSPSRCSINY